MKITVINGTEIKGCTYHIKEAFLSGLRQNSEITEFTLPKDMPHFCRGCKTCFFKSEGLCPHADHVMPIWNAMLDADLLVFASPVYALRTTGQMKALLDHLCVHWMVHRPDRKMFSKRAVILTNAIGMFNGGAQKDISTSLTWLGVSDIKKLGIGLMEGVVWNELSARRRADITRRVEKLADKQKNKPAARRGLKVGFLFAVVKKMHLAVAKKEAAQSADGTLSADNRYWVDQGWISP